MSYSNSFPQQRPTLNLDFANSGKLDSRISFSRADTPPTYAAPSAVHYWSNEKHLSSENLITNSEDFSAWTANNTTPTVNAVAAPDGNTTADTVTGNSGTSSKYVSSNSISAAPYPVISVYVKAGTHNYVQIHNDQSSTHYANFDVTSGAGVVGSVGSNTTSTIQAVGSTGWYRCICRINTASMTSGIKVRLVDSASAAYAASSATTGTVHLWGAMATDIGDLTNIAAYQSSGSQIHREYSSTLKSVANAGDPRFEYSPADGQSVGSGTALGLLVESQATNLTKYSDDFSSWGGLSTVVVTQNAGVAPNGQLEADLLVSPSSASAHYILDSTIAFTSGTTYTASVYVKSAGHRYVQLGGNSSAFGTSPYQYVNYDLEAGTLNANNCSGTISSVGNGYYRITATMTATVTSTKSFILMFADSLSAGFFPTTTGDDYSGFLAFGFQTESGSSASSLISTNGSQVSRASDSCSVAVSQLGLTSSQDVTLLVEGDYRDPAVFANNRFAVALGKDSQSYISLYNGAGESGSGYIRTNGPTEFYNASGVTSGNFKAAISAKNNSVKYAANGTSFTEDTDAELPQYTELKVGEQFVSDRQIGGTISRVAVYGQALSSTELAALTSS